MTLRYPNNIDSSTDFMRIQIGSYSSPLKGTTASEFAYNANPNSFTKSKEIYLNMPDSLGSTFTGAWNGKPTSALAQYALGQFAVPIGKSLKEGGALSLPTLNLAAATSAAVTDIVTAIGNKLGEIPGIGSNLSANDFLQIATETIINPNTELLYGGPGLRNHGYTFKLIPRNEGEAEQIINIVNEFKLACLPKNQSQFFGNDATKSRNFIGVPDVCQVQFMQQQVKEGGSGENPNLPKYKTSAFTSVSTNYITDNQYMSYRDGRPIGISLTITLIELKLVFREDVVAGVAR